MTLDPANPFMFVQPSTMLPPYLKKAVADLSRHGFCIVEDGFIRELGGRDPRTAAILQMFQEACRMVSIEKDQNLLINDRAVAPHVLVALAPHGHDGTLPEIYVEDTDKKGVIDREPLLAEDPTGPQLEIKAKFDT